jgi:hypothetical protein
VDSVTEFAANAEKLAEYRETQNRADCDDEDHKHGQHYPEDEPCFREGISVAALLGLVERDRAHDDPRDREDYREK